MRKIVRRIYVDIIVVVLVFVVGFLTGTERAQRLYKDEQVQAITELRQRENQIRNDYDEIIQNLTEQQNAITFQSTYLRDDVKQLHHSTDQVQSYITSKGSCYSKTPFAELFIRCTERYSIMAETAERHATDAENTVKAWSKIKENIDNIDNSNK